MQSFLFSFGGGGGGGGEGGGGGGGEERRPGSTCRPIGSCNQTVVQYDRLHNCVQINSSTPEPPFYLRRKTSKIWWKDSDFHCNFLRKYGRLTDLIIHTVHVVQNLYILLQMSLYVPCMHAQYLLCSLKCNARGGGGGGGGASMDNTVMQIEPGHISVLSHSVT